jgi:hypothetical protein
MAYKPYRYVMSCVGSTFEDISAMTEEPPSRDVTRGTFVRHTNDQDRRELEEALGYGPWLGITSDWHVSYHKSVFRGVPCYYLRHSHIEYIFTLHGELGPSAAEPSRSTSLWPGHFA